MLGAVLHQCPWAATATKLSLSPGILLTEENYSLACMLHAKQTIFSCLHLSPHCAIKAWLGEQREGQKSGDFSSFSFKTKNKANVCTLVVTQVIIGSDREMCRLFRLLSHELCLVLPSISTKWTVNDDCGICAIFLVCTWEEPQSSPLLMEIMSWKRVWSHLNDFPDRVIDCIDITFLFSFRVRIFALLC